MSNLTELFKRIDQTDDETAALAKIRQEADDGTIEVTPDDLYQIALHVYNKTNSPYAQAYAQLLAKQHYILAAT